MGVFTKILDKEREFIEEQYQIKILDIKNISNGILNSNFQIDCEDIKYILRIFEADRTLNEEEQELILLNKIASPMLTKKIYAITSKSTSPVKD